MNTRMLFYSSEKVFFCAFLCLAVAVLAFSDQLLGEIQYSIPPSRQAAIKIFEGSRLLRVRNWDAGYQAFCEAVEVIEKDEPLSSYGLIRAQLGCGWASMHSRNYPRARSHFEKALNEVNSSSLKDSLLKIEVLRALAALHSATLDKQEAVNHYEEAIKLLYKETPAYWVTLAETFEEYAAFIRTLPRQEGWFGILHEVKSQERNPEHLEKRAKLLRARAKNEPYTGAE